MADESIITYKKPGFPKKSLGQKNYSTSIEYVGPTATLEAAMPAIGATWGDYTGYVQSRDIEPIEGTAGYSDLKIVVAYEFSGSDTTFGEAKEITYEIEWAPQAKSLLEHPQFRMGGAGANVLSKQDVIDIGFWENEQDATLKEAYQYNELAATGSGAVAELTASGKLYCAGLMLGQDYWDDFAPVARKNTTYVNGPPTSSTAGKKDTPSGFPNLPTGYEWRKSADRSVRAGGQNRWERTEEWTGAKTILVDRDAIYWTTP